MAMGLTPGPGACCVLGIPGHPVGRSVAGLKYRESHGEATWVLLCRHHLYCVNPTVGGGRAPRQAGACPGVWQGGGRKSLSQPGPWGYWGWRRLWAEHEPPSASDLPVLCSSETGRCCRELPESSPLAGQHQGTSSTLPSPEDLPAPSKGGCECGGGGRLPRRTGGAQGLCGVEPGALPSIRQTFEALLGAGTQGTDTNLLFHSRGAVEPPCEACSEAMLPTWVVQEVPDSSASPQGKEAP